MLSESPNALQYPKPFFEPHCPSAVLRVVWWDYPALTRLDNSSVLLLLCGDCLPLASHGHTNRVRVRDAHEHWTLGASVLRLLAPSVLESAVYYSCQQLALARVPSTISPKKKSNVSLVAAGFHFSIFDTNVWRTHHKRLHNTDRSHLRTKK